MSELTLLVLRIGFLAALWVFVFFVVYSIRADLFGERVRRLPGSSPDPETGGIPALFSGVATKSKPEAMTQPRVESTNRTIAAASDQINLVLTSGSLAGNSLALTGEPITIGRSPDSTLVIRDDYTSTNHARIWVKGGNWVLSDLDSTNGTLCGGVAVSGTVPLHLGEPITVGTTSFELQRRL